MIMRQIILFILSLSIIAKPLFSQTPGSPEADSIDVRYVLDPIIKTASKMDGAQRDIAASISLVDEDQIRLASGCTVLEILQHRIPGLHVTEWGVMGFGAAGQSAGKISLRGVGGGANTHVLILRNGRPDFMGLMGCTIADEFSLDGLERIEVIRGPGSFLYGTNATGGVINLIPKRRSRQGFETHLGGGYGAFDTRSLMLNHGGKIGSLDYFVTVNHRQSDGHREGSDYRGRYYTAHFGYEMGEKSTVEMNANLADMRVEDPGSVTDPHSDDWYDLLRFGADIHLRHESRWGETHLKLHGNFGKHDFFDGWHSDDRLLGFMAYHHVKPRTGHTTTVGFDYKRYGGNAVDASMDYGAFFVTEYAAYIHSQQLLAGRFILSGGLRAEHHELCGTEWLPKAGLVSHVTSSSSLRLSAAKGFRSPSLRELYFWLPANDSLKPDRVWNYEAALEQRVGRRMEVEAAVFLVEGSDLIQFQAPPPRWENSGSYRYTGYEILFRWVPTARIGVDASWSRMNVPFDVFNVPGKKLTFQTRYVSRYFTLSLNLMHVGDWTGAEFTGSPVPVLHPMCDYTVVNSTLLIRPLPYVELKLMLRNAFDEDYEAMYGYPMPGRHVLMDIRYQIGAR